MNSFIFISVVCFLILPKIGVVDLSIISLSIASILILITNNYLYKINERILYLSFISISIFVVSIISFFFNDALNFDIQFVFKPIRILIILYLLTLVFSYFDKRTIIKIIAIAAFVNSLVICIQYLFQYFSISDAVLLNPNFSERVITPYRKPGLMSGYPTAGILSIIGFISATYLFVTSRRYKDKVLYCIFLFITALTCFLTARTAVYFFIIFGLPFFVISSLSNKQYKNIAIISIFIMLVFGYIIISDSKIINGTVDKMFVNISNYIETGSFFDYSTKDLVTNHYTLPYTDKDFLIGNSLPAQLNVVNSDVSLFRIVWANGVFSAILYFFSFFYMTCSAYFCAKGRIDKLMVIFFFVPLLIANAKGFYIFSRVIGDISILFWGACVYKK